MQQQRIQRESSSNPSRRYSAEAVREILARATELEAEEADLLSEAQVEELGKQLDIHPGAVRRALAEREGQHRAIPTTLSKRTQQQIWLKAITAVCMPGSCFALIATWILLTWGGQASHVHFFMAAKVLVTWIPLLIAFLLGWWSQSKRLGAIGGVVGVTSSFLGFIIVRMMSPAGSAIHHFHGWHLLLYFCLISGPMAGIIGSLFSRLAAKWYAGVRPQ